MKENKKKYCLLFHQKKKKFYWPVEQQIMSNETRLISSWMEKTTCLEYDFGDDERDTMCSMGHFFPDTENPSGERRRRSNASSSFNFARERRPLRSHLHFVVGR